ncbi:MAG: metal ABC transporter solute-binding protein, Zn/Mn family [Candidatus Limisoma sp.]
MKKLYFLFLVAVLLMSCSGKGDNSKPVITVSIEPQRYFVEKIAGDRFKVRCMLDKGGSPETYEPSMANMMSLEKSSAYFFMGKLGFETAIRGKITEYNPNIKAYDLSQGVTMLEGCHHFDADDEHGTDPHIWTSVVNAKIIVANIHAALCELDPDGTKIYDENLRTFTAELDELQSQLDARLADCRGKSFLVWHPSLSYFANDYGLQQISVEYEGKESPLKYVKDKIDLAKSSGATVFFLQKDMDSAQAASVNAEIGAKIVEINPLSYDWKTEIVKIADAIAQ